MILTGDCRQLIPTLKPESVDCIITSPPYFNLRDYGMLGQIGAEKTITDYIAALTDVFSKARSILKPNGTLWINIGDSYAGSGKGKGSFDPKYADGRCKDTMIYTNWSETNIAPRNLMGIPWKLAFSLQDNGWILRQDLIWSKPNAMPESVANRCTKSHEYIFLLSKEQTYYFDIDSIKETARYDVKDSPKINKNRRYGGKKYTQTPDKFYRTKSGKAYSYTGTRHPRSVWNIPTQPFKGEHFATFPEELVRRCILAGCPKGGTVLDPFCGSGTAGKVAYDLGREFIGIELNPQYVAIAQKRIGTTKQISLEGVQV